MRQPRRIAVIGCGPAGLAFSLAMVRQGTRVDLLERFESPTAIGSGVVLQPPGLRALESLGLRSEIESVGNRIDRILGHTIESDRLVIDVDYSLLGRDTYAVALHRSRLFSIINAHLERKDVSITGSTEIIEYRLNPDTTVDLRDSNDNWLGPYDLVVDASGANSAIRKQASGNMASQTLEYGSLWATLNAPAGVFSPNTLVQRFAERNVSIGLMPLGAAFPGGPAQTAFFWNIRCADYPAWRADGLSVWKARVHEMWPDCRYLTDQIDSADQLTLARYRHHSFPDSPVSGIVFIGDAAHATSPQLGQGVNMGLLDAISLSRALRTQGGVPAAVRYYQKQRQNQVRLVLETAKLLIPFYQADNRIAIRLRDSLFQPMSQLPYVRHLIARMVAG